MSQTNSLNIILSEDMVRFVRTTGLERRAKIYFKLVGDRVNMIGIFYGGRQYDSSR